MLRSLKLACLALMVVGVLLMAMGQSFAQEDIAVAEAVAGDDVGSTESPSSRFRPLTVSAGLVDDTVISGTLIDSTSIAIKTAFGEASIPLSEVAGIRFPGGDDNSTTIVMLNGDSITGATDLKFASVETTWGSAKINGPNIETMLFVPGLTWQSSEGLAGKRWGLVEKATTSSVRQASATQSTNQNQRMSNGQSSPSQPSPFPSRGRSQIFFGQ